MGARWGEGDTTPPYRFPLSPWERVGVRANRQRSFADLPDPDPVPTVGRGGGYARHMKLPTDRPPTNSPSPRGVGVRGQSTTFYCRHAGLDPVPMVGRRGDHAQHLQIATGRQHPSPITLCGLNIVILMPCGLSY